MNARRSKLSEQGFASLTIGIVLVIVLSLLTVGFAELMRNELNQVTNRQLESQAYYAAESGVNDAVKALNNGFTTQKTHCGPTINGPPTPDLSLANPGAQYLANSTVNSTSIWSCLLIDPSPPELQYGSVDTVTPITFVATGVKNQDETTAVPISSVTFWWSDAAGGTGRRPAGNQTFPPSDQWNAIGLLRVALTPLPSFDRATLTANTFVAYLDPNVDSNGQTTNYVAQSGAIADGGCVAGQVPRMCKVTINNINDPAISPGVYAPVLFNLRSIYSATSVYITAADSGGTLINLKGAQSLVDSTGRSQNILKRIQVYVPNQDTYTTPGFTLDATGGICKEYSVYPGAIQDDAGICN